ncbi:outer membrane adhesin-like protein [Paucimonas lemoignei]|nr:outer membrane adhesin-like protein [Paucimonas lemoignei]
MSTQSDLAELYTTFFNRAPDADGLAYWVDSIDTGQLSLTQIAENWLTEQTEGQTNFPTTLTDAQFVAKIYTNVLSRTADADGAQYWLDQLASGAVTRDSFALSIINGAKANTSAQGVLDATLISNKATVGVAFAEQGVNDTALAAKVLTTVTADASTLNSTLAVIALIPTTAAAQTPAILAATDQLLTNFANLITAAPGELADATTYLQTLAAGITSGTNITTLLSNANTLITSAATNSAALDNPAAQGEAAVVVATPGTGGGTPAPGATTFTATDAKNDFSLTSGVDTFVTKFGGEAVKQVDTITFTAYEVGDIVTLAGVATADVVFTVTNVSTVAADVATAVNNAAGAKVVASVVDSKLTLTANTAGTGFIAVASSTNKAAVDAVKQVDTITFTAFEVGDILTIAGVATADVVFTVTNASTVAADVATAVNNAPGAKVVASVVDSNLTLTANTAGTGFTAVASSTNKATVDAVKQVDTLTFTAYEVGDIVTIAGVATADVVFTVTNVSTVAADVATAVNNATGAKVVASVVDSKLALTANAAGTGFTAIASSTNKPAVDAVKQVDTVKIASVYDIGDTITVTGVASNDIVFTVSDPTTVSADLVALINAAGGLTVEADVVDATNVTLTALTAGNPFTAVATDSRLETTVEITTPNKVAVPAGADTQVVNLAHTTQNAPEVVGDNTQAVNLAHTTVNQVAVVGTDNQTASVAHTKVNLVAADSLSAVGTLDVLTGFTPGTDKVELFTFGGPVTSPSALTHVADVTTGTDLVTQLTTAFSGITAGNAGLVTIAAGNVNAGTYLFANDNNDAFSATDDVVIKLVGVTLPSGAGSLNVADYFVSSPSV